MAASDRAVRAFVKSVAHVISSNGCVAGKTRPDRAERVARGSRRRDDNGNRTPLQQRVGKAGAGDKYRYVTRRLLRGVLPRCRTAMISVKAPLQFDWDCMQQAQGGNMPCNIRLPGSICA